MHVWLRTESPFSVTVKQYETPAPPVKSTLPGAELLTIGILIATEHSSIQALTESTFASAQIGDEKA
jgi:hypothetical protein